MQHRNRLNSPGSGSSAEILTAIAGALLLCALMGACASTAPAPPVGYSGFLRDYSILTPGEGADEPALRYVNPDANLGSYTKVMIDPVVV